MDRTTLGPESPKDFVPRLGAHHIVFLVVAAAAPLGFAVGAIPLAIGRGGIGTAGTFLVVGVFLAIFAQGFIAMSRFVPNSGAFFSYVAAGLGRPLGLGTAFLATFAYALATIGTFGGFAVFASQATSALVGVRTAWQLWAFGGVAVVGLLGIRNIDLNLRVLAIMLTAELAVLLILACSIIAVGGAQGLSLSALRPTSLYSGGAGVILLFVFAAFAGFEASVLFREDARNPDVTLPRATFMAIALIAIFQAFVSWAIVQAFGDQAVAIASRDPTNMFAFASVRFVGRSFAQILDALVVMSWLASVISFHNITTRYIYLLARDHAIPGVLRIKSERTGAPVAASLLLTALSGIAIWICSAWQLDPFQDLLIIASVPTQVGLPAMECLVSLSIMAFFWKNRRGLPVTTVVIAPAISFVVLIVVLYLDLSNIALSTARNGALNWILPTADLAVLIAGGARALWLRRTNPTAYARLGHWGERSASSDDRTTGPGVDHSPLAVGV